MEKDNVLYNEIIKKISLEPILQAGAKNIQVAVHQGLVTLSGELGSYIERLTIEQVIENLPGIKGIANEIKVQPQENMKKPDGEILYEAVYALNKHLHIPENAIKIIVDEGWVTLTGEVEWHYQKEAAELAIRHLSGIRGITNDIAIKSRLEILSESIEKNIIEALKSHVGINPQNIEVKVKVNNIILTGTVSSWPEMLQVSKVVWSIPGVETIDNRFVIA